MKESFFCAINFYLFRVFLSNKFLGDGLSVSQNLYIAGSQGVLGKWMMTPAPSTPLSKGEI